MRVGAFPATDDDHRVSAGRQLTGFPLTGRRGVADGVVLLKLRNPLTQHLDDSLPPVRRERRLGGRDGLGKHRQRRRFLRVQDDIHIALGPAAGALDLGMLPLPHHDDGGAVRRALGNDAVEPVHKGAGQVQHGTASRAQILQHVRRDAVAADEHLAALRVLRRGNGGHTMGGEHIDHRGIMNQRAKGTGGHISPRNFHGCLHCTANAHAESGVCCDLKGHKQLPFAKCC